MALIPQNMESLRYAELQQLAKQCGVKANMKAEKLKAALVQYRQNQPSDGSNKTLQSEAAQKNPDDVKVAKKSSVSASRSATRSSRSSAKSTPQMSMPKIKDKSADCDRVQSSSFTGAEELPLSPDDEVFMHNSRPGKHSMLEPDYPSVNTKSSHPAPAKVTGVKKPISWAAIHEGEFAKMDSRLMST